MLTVAGGIVLAVILLGALDEYGSRAWFGPALVLIVMAWIVLLKTGRIDCPFCERRHADTD